MTFSLGAITFYLRVHRCTFCADSARSDVSWQLSCRIYDL